MLNNIATHTDHNELPSGCGPLLLSAQSQGASLKQQVFEQVRANGRATRTAITQALDISAGSTTTLTADLITKGVLREVDQPSKDTGRGRPRVALEVVPDAAYVIGIKLAFEEHAAVLSDFAGNVIATATSPSTDKRRTTLQLLDEVAALIDQLIAQSNKTHNDIKAIGVGLPGIVDHVGGVITWSSLLHDRNQDLRAAFAARFDIPLFLDNDTNMLTLAELWFGIGREMTDFVVVTIEDGVGMGLAFNNQLYRGSHGMGLELGHTKVQLDGALCACGQRGCLEAYLADYALTREAATALDHGNLTPRSQKELLTLLFAQAKLGNDAAETIFRRAGRFLSVGLANVVQLFDPPLIILSGKRMHHNYLYADTVLAEMQKLTLSDGRQSCKIHIHAWDNLVWARGATVPALTAITGAMIDRLEVLHA